MGICSKENQVVSIDNLIRIEQPANQQEMRIEEGLLRAGGRLITRIGDNEVENINYLKEVLNE